MTEIENPATIVSGVIALGITIVGGIWKFGRELAEAESRINAAITAQRREVGDLIDQAENRFAETVRSTKEHTNRVELWATRDLATKKEVSEGFSLVRDDISSMVDDMKDGFKVVHYKLDRASEWRSHLSRGETPE